MTTPAVNESATSNRGGTRTRWDNGELSWTAPTTPNLASVFQHTRPESGTAVMIRDFRLCRNWSHIRRHFVQPDGAIVYVNGPARTEDKGCIWAMPTNFGVPPGVSNNLRNEALTKALENLRASDFHVGEFIAEGRETIAMFATMVRRITGGVNRYRKQYPYDWRKARTTEGRVPRERWCEIPSLWLELQYGWKPLMASVFGAVNHMSDRWRFSLPYVTVKSYAESTDTLSWSTNSTLWPQGKFNCERRSQVWTNLVFGLKNPTVAEISSLGLLNPAEIVWEKLPYSFVVDWAVPIGSWISSWTAAAGYQFITGGQSLKETVKPVDGSITYTGGAIASPPTTKGRAEYFSRVCYASTPVPGIYVKDPFSLGHLANGLSLLAQAFR